MTLVAKLLWTGRDFQRTVKALLGQRKRKRRALQDYEAFDDYFDEVEWAGLSSRAGYIHKKSIVLTKLEKLGLTNPKEMTVKKINSTLICTTYDDLAKIAEHTKISHYEQLKKDFDAIQRRTVKMGGVHTELYMYGVYVEVC